MINQVSQVKSFTLPKPLAFQYYRNFRHTKPKVINWDQFIRSLLWQNLAQTKQICKSIFNWSAIPLAIDHLSLNCRITSFSGTNSHFIDHELPWQENVLIAMHTIETDHPENTYLNKTNFFLENINLQFTKNALLWLQKQKQKDDKTKPFFYPADTMGLKKLAAHDFLTNPYLLNSQKKERLIPTLGWGVAATLWHDEHTRKFRSLFLTLEHFYGSLALFTNLAKCLEEALVSRVKWQSIYLICPHLALFGLFLQEMANKQIKALDLIFGYSPNLGMIEFLAHAKSGDILFDLSAFPKVLVVACDV